MFTIDLLHGFPFFSTIALPSSACVSPNDPLLSSLHTYPSHCTPGLFQFSPILVIFAVPRMFSFLILSFQVTTRWSNNTLINFPFHFLTNKKGLSAERTKRSPTLLQIRSTSQSLIWLLFFHLCTCLFTTLAYLSQTPASHKHWLVVLCHKPLLC